MIRIDLGMIELVGLIRVSLQREVDIMVVS